MLPPIHILVVDDTPDLLQGTALLLRKAGYTVGTAATGGEALAYVHATPPHIVLLDRQLPDVDGIEVCRQIKAAQIAANICIVVMVSGFHTGLDAQLAGLETGADGYIARPVSNRELLVRMESFARIVRLTQSLADKTEKIRVQDANLEQRVQERTASLALANQKLDEARRAAFSMTEDANLARKRLAAANDELRREIAHREQAEASLRFSQFVMENMADAVFWLNEDGRVCYANAAACRMLGYTKEDLLSLHIRDLTTAHSPESYAALWKELQRAGSLFFESFMLANGGRIFPVEVRANFMSFGGKSYDCGFVRDITERRRAEDQARRWQRVFQTSGFSLAHTNPATNTFIEVNNACASLLGYTPDELAGKPILTIYAPEAVADLRAKLAGIDEAGHAAFESTFIRKDGTKLAVFVDVTSILDSRGKPTSRVAYAQEITDRKRAEQMIQRHTQLLTQAGNAARFGYYVADVATGLVEISPMLEEVFGIGPDFQRDLSENGWGKLVHPDDWEETSRSFARTMAGEGDFRHDYRIIRHNDGQLRWLAGYGIPELGADGKPARIIGCIQDITERKRTEAALKESEERFRAYIEQAADAVMIHDLGGRFVDVNKVACERLGYTRAELLELGVPDVEVELALFAMQSSWKDTKPGQRRTEIGRHRRKDGTTFPVEVAFNVFDLRGRRLFLCLVSDITERHQAQERASLLRKLGFALAQSSDMNEMLHLCLDTAIRVSGMDCGWLYLEKEPVGDLELVCQSGLSEDFIAAVSCVQTHRVSAAMPRGKKAFYGTSNQKKGAFHTAEEREGLHALAVIPVYHADDLVACLNVASHTADEFSAAGCDALETVASLIGGVIHRLRDKAELQASAERLRSLLASMDDLVFVLSRDLVFQQYHQPSNARLLVPPSEFVGKSFDEINFPEPGSGIIKSALLKTLETGETTTAEYHLDHSGVRMWFDMHVTPFKSQDGRTTGLTCVVRNVTETRRTAESLRESDLRLSMAVQSANMGVWDVDMQTGKTLWLGNTESLFGYAPGEYGGTQAEFESRIPTDDLETMKQIGQQAVKERKPFQVEHRVIWPDGSVHWLSSHGQHFFDGEGKPVRLTGVVFDITERKKAEQELSDRASELQRRNQELDRFNRSAVGREIRMIELKQEVNDLCRSANLPPRYGTDAAEMLAAARPASPKTPQ